jgi:HEPN domain-containing protein
VKNPSLVDDFLKRCQARLKGIETLFAEKSWPDVVRDSQLVVELALKALLRFSQIEVPRIHDVSAVLETNIELLPAGARPHLKKMARISRQLRRDRELAFYGSEDLTPSEFYKREDAEQAKADAAWVLKHVIASIASRGRATPGNACK